MALNENPYEPPTGANNSTSASGNAIGRTGFALSLAGVVGLFLIGPFGSFAAMIGAPLTFLCFPGLVISTIGVFRQPRRLAGWGIAIGAFGSLYLPTICLPLVRALR